MILPLLLAATLTGEVRERGTRDPVPFAVVIAQSPTGTVRAESDDKGEFTLDLAPGGWDITILAGEYLRYQAHENVAGQVRVRYFLERRRYGRYETVVRGKPAREEVERHTLETEEITKIPGTNGDALRSVENLPGMARAPFNSGLLVVRGSPPEDSLVLIDGHQLPQLYHFGGLTSVWNSDLVARIDYLPGNASVRYGRFLGGVVDVQPREPRRDDLHGYVNTNVFDTGVLLEGPAAGGGSFAIAGRRSYIDAILPAILPSDSGINLTVAPRYYDYQALLFEPAGGGRLRVYLYGSDDRLTFVSQRPADDPALRGTFDTALYFHNLYAGWQRSIGDWRLRVSAQPGFQHQSAAIGENLDFRIEYLNLDERIEVSRNFGRVRLDFGFDGEVVHYDALAHVPRPPNEGDVMQQPISGMTIFAIDTAGWDWVPALWGQVELDAGHGLTLTPGVRVDYFHFIDQLTIDPRLSVRLALSDRTALVAAAGLFHEEPPPQFSDPTLGNPLVRAESAMHYALGVEHRPTDHWKIEATAFYKDLQSLAAPSSAYTIRDGKIVPEVYDSLGSGRVVGVEFLVRRELARGLFGWIAYTLLESDRRDAPDQPLHPSDFDQTHVFVGVVSYKFACAWEAGLRFRYTTGNPYTPVTGGIFDADHDVYQPVPGAKNSQRLPAFNQLDVRVDRRWVFDRWMLTAYLDVQNVYNEGNVEAVLYNFDYSRTAQVTGLPIIPSIGIKGEF